MPERHNPSSTDGAAPLASDSDVVAAPLPSRKSLRLAAEARRRSAESSEPAAATESPAAPVTATAASPAAAPSAASATPTGFDASDFDASDSDASDFDRLVGGTAPAATADDLTGSVPILMAATPTVADIAEAARLAGHDARTPRRSAPARPAPARPRAGVPAPARGPEYTKRAKRRRSLRSVVIVGLAIPGLMATVGLPAYAFSTGEGALINASAQLTRGSDANAQTLAVPGDASAVELNRDSYGATNADDAIAAQAAGAITGDSAGALDGYMNPSSDGWWRPLPGPITSPYGPRNLICNSVGCSNSFHEGMDFGNACGTPIRAAYDGTVTFVGNAGAYGNRVIIDHGDGSETIYGHLLTGSASVAVGDEVSGGAIIAEVGATGVVSGCHLDLKVMVDDEMTDPAVFLTSKGVTV